MRVIWTLLKVVIALAIAIPVGILVLGATLGVLGALIGLSLMVLKLACIGLVGYGVYRLARALFAPSSAPAPRARELPPVDPYYDAAMRELDTELGHRR